MEVVEGCTDSEGGGDADAGRAEVEEEEVSGDGVADDGGYQ